ncbi:hypothetical protein [Streptomyces sp. NBC_00829]|uniref:hypothetical protein n=1 Tax=Streptomyces sp. NBC_00829 TaxID=2903679 RepID=UPI0038649624|nr:hypothetical protein OG293_35995 [Streptomyces sp. NBC_00829]
MPTSTPVVRDQLDFEPFADLFALPQETAEPAAVVEEPEKSYAHVWTVAAEIKVEDRVAQPADFRGSSTTVQTTRVDALEVYCPSRRRPYEDVADRECEALPDNRHPVGGDQTQRAKRKVQVDEAPELPSTAKAIPRGVIQRRGIGAYVVSGVSGVSRTAR